MESKKKEVATKSVVTPPGLEMREQEAKIRRAFEDTFRELLLRQEEAVKPRYQDGRYVYKNRHYLTGEAVDMAKQETKTAIQEANGLVGSITVLETRRDTEFDAYKRSTPGFIGEVGGNILSVEFFFESRSLSPGSDSHWKPGDIFRLNRNQDGRAQDSIFEELAKQFDSGLVSKVKKEMIRQAVIRDIEAFKKMRGEASQKLGIILEADQARKEIESVEAQILILERFLAQDSQKR